MAAHPRAPWSVRPHEGNARFIRGHLDFASPLRKTFRKTSTWGGCNDDAKRERNSMTSRPTWSKPNTAIAVAKCLRLIVIATVVLALRVPAFGQDRMVLGPRQFERDTGAGAVLCLWSIYLSVQAETAACGLARRSVDDAIDEAIVAIDEFILANSSLHPTRAMLEDFKRRATDRISASRANVACRSLARAATLSIFAALVPTKSGHR
jgi:hypothetical protein